MEFINMEWLATWYFDGLPDPPRSGHTCHERAPAWLTQVRYRFTRVLGGGVQVNRVLPGSKPLFGLFVLGRGFKGALSLIAKNIKSPNQHSLGHPDRGWSAQ